jgi:rhodanese-related sulfurtransferase
MDFLNPGDIIEGNVPDNAQFIDVREPEEYACVRWPLFANMPLSVFERSLDQLDIHRPVVLLCKVGMRSLKAGIFLQKMGFESVWNVDGGIDAASDEGAPLEIL